MPCPVVLISKWRTTAFLSASSELLCIAAVAEWHPAGDTRLVLVTFHSTVNTFASKMSTLWKQSATYWLAELCFVFLELSWTVSSSKADLFFRQLLLFTVDKDAGSFLSDRELLNCHTATLILISQHTCKFSWLLQQNPHFHHRSWISNGCKSPCLSTSKQSSAELLMS